MGERDFVGGKTEIFADRVERPDLWQLDSEVRKEHILGALPLLFRCGYLVVLKLVLRMLGIESMMIQGMARPK